MFKRRIIETIKEIAGLQEIELETPEIETFGDYSTNVAMVLAKKGGKNPPEVAKNLVELLQKSSQLGKIVSKIEVAGPGFINFWLSEEALFQNLKEISDKKEKYGTNEEGAGKTVVIDYSSPNIAKRFGIGQLRSTVIGQALYNLYKSLGYKVIGDNHLGDWGTQFGTLLYQIESKKLDPAKLSINELEDLYVEFNKEAEGNEKLWDEARAYFKKLESGDSKAKEVWQKVVEISMQEFDKIYDLLGVKIDYAHGESFYGDKMPEVIEELRAKGLTKKSEGAEIVEFPQMPPAMVIKSDGTTTYFTRDLATIKYRIATWNPDLFIYEVGSDQILHFRQVFACAKLLGWNDKMHYEHVAHGLIRFSSGKMSTREGKTIKLEEVLDEAVQRAWNIIEKSETGRGLSKEEREKVADSVGIGAIKYFDLIHHPQSDILFDWDKIFILEGNSAPYLQYTVARTNSVLAKAKTVNSQKSSVSLNPEELAVLRALIRFPDVIHMAANNFSPNLLANYLFELAQKYNNFYAHHRILPTNSERTKGEALSVNQHRIMLTKATGQVLKNGLGILGIDTPERM